MAEKRKPSPKVQSLVGAVRLLPSKDKKKLDRLLVDEFQQWDSKALIALLEHNLFHRRMPWPEAMSDVLDKILRHGSPLEAKVRTLGE